jgi:hypothetical protein
VQGTECPVLDPLVLEPNEVEVTTRKLDQFVYWGERLEYLLQVYNEHEPKTLIQWIRDDRRPAQKWTFWIAAFAFVIATLSLVAAVLQTWASLASYSTSNDQTTITPCLTCYRTCSSSSWCCFCSFDFVSATKSGLCKASHSFESLCLTGLSLSRGSKCHYICWNLVYVRRMRRRIRGGGEATTAEDTLEASESTICRPPRP